MADETSNTSDGFVPLAEIFAASRWGELSSSGDLDLGGGGGEPSRHRPGHVGQHRRPARRGVGTLLTARSRAR
jgi:hypothetical protein